MITYYLDGTVEISKPNWGARWRKKDWTKIDMDLATTGKLIEEEEWINKTHYLYQGIDCIWRRMNAQKDDDCGLSGTYEIEDNFQ